MKHLRSAVVLSALMLSLTSPLAPAHAQGNGTNTSSIAIPVTATGAGGAFTGTFALQRFVENNGVVSAVGTLTGVVTETSGDVVGSIVRTLSIPINTGATQATCDILHLELGPLNLDLLGLVVDLNQIVLDITAEPGPGNLLGNLLCSVAGLLDNPNALVNLLNRILGALG